MNRFQYVIAASEAPHQVPLIDLARVLVQALEQNEALGTDAYADPAVRILGAYIAFHTHADVDTAQGYKHLLAMCEKRLYDASEAH